VISVEKGFASGGSAPSEKDNRVGSADRCPSIPGHSLKMKLPVTPKALFARKAIHRSCL